MFLDIMEPTLTCGICAEIITGRKHKIFCTICRIASHRTCLPSMSSTEFSQTKLTWLCAACVIINSNQPEPLMKDPEKCQLIFNDSYFQDSTAKSNTEQPEFSSTARFPKGLIFAHLNINGIRSKFCEVQELLSFEKNL